MFAFLRLIDRLRGSPAAYLATLVLTCGAIAWSVAALGSLGLRNADQLMRLPQDRSVAPAAAQAAPERHGRIALTQDAWHERITKREFWSGRGGSAGPYVLRSNLQGLFSPTPLDAAAPYYEGDGKTYRTMCVRLCDGYYFPISYSTTTDNFHRDRVSCERSCSSPSRLYVYRNPGGEPDDMRDLDGQPYTKLSTAFLYRTKYEAACKCRPDPWEQEAQTRHKLYALDAARAKGNLAAGAEAQAIRARILAERKAGAGRKVGSLNTISATIVAADGASAAEPDSTTHEVKAAPPPPKPARRQAAGDGSPGAMMRLGGSSDSSGRGATSSARGSVSTGSSGDWRVRVFQGH